MGTAILLAVIRLVQRQSIKYVVQAVIPTAIAVLIATRTGRAQDVFLPGILYNGALAVISLLTVAIRKPLVGFIIGAAVGDPTGWTRDRGLVKMTSKLTLVLAVPYVARFVIQLPLFLAGQVVLLGIAKVVLGWPMLIGALTVIGFMLSKGKTPMEDSAFAGSLAPESPPREPRSRLRARSVLGDCLYARRRCLGDADRAVARGQHLGKLLLEVLGGDEQQLVARLQRAVAGPAVGRARRG